MFGDLLYLRHAFSLTLPSPAKRARVNKRPILGVLRIEKPPRPFQWQRAGVRGISFSAGERKIMKSIRGLLVFAFLFSATGCLVGPDYQRPQIDTPPTWRVEDQTAQAVTNTNWWEQYNDPVLNEL